MKLQILALVVALAAIIVGSPALVGAQEPPFPSDAKDEFAQGVERYKSSDSGTGRALAISAILSAVLKVALWGLKTWGSSVFRRPVVLRLTCLSVGLAAAVFSWIGMGEPWYNVVIMALGGPGAILITEIQKIPRDLRRASDESD